MACLPSSCGGPYSSTVGALFALTLKPYALLASSTEVTIKPSDTFSVWMF